MSLKVLHVLNAKQTREHTCHWPGCNEQVPPAKWGCAAHWFKLPKYLRNKIWESYRIGQEQDLRVSTQYIVAAREVQEWIEAQDWKLL